ncbi:hypothetical protein KO561_17640 [Radiobacillus kanasensis]|uniref:hypothetical protein n=1 Tax=Radiobacillus kanasensis TaxID=2844358 RepID=UPI001E2E70DB|nr:hypothetical protein [Radiobacillus kanasensis]UFT98988.1 hypothetical protein KO561_17640 [Radiobacillus kanasensis]
MKELVTYLVFCVILFAAWVIIALYFSTGDEWWTIYQVQQVSFDVMVAKVSWLRVTIFLLMATVIAFVPYRLVYFQANRTE